MTSNIFTEEELQQIRLTYGIRYLISDITYKEFMIVPNAISVSVDNLKPLLEAADYTVKL